MLQKNNSLATSNEPNNTFIYLFFGHVICGTLISRPVIEPMMPALEVRSRNHSTALEVPIIASYNHKDV